MSWVWPALVVAIPLLGCAGASPSASSLPGAAPSAIERPEALCLQDTLRAARVRFRAAVRTAEGENVAEGILLMRRPGDLRVKLFGIAGLTVHDALWRGDGSEVQGVLRGLGLEEPALLRQTPERPVTDPASRLSLLLWSLWQPRCVRPPERRERTPEGTWFAVDPEPAQVRMRSALLAGDELRAERLQGIDGEEILVRFEDFDHSLRPALPRRLEIAAPAAAWSAAIAITEYTLDETLAEGLFALPGSNDPPP